MEKDHVLCGSEVISHTFIRRHFQTNSRGNLDCHLKMPDNNEFTPEQLAQEDQEFADYLDQIFDK